MPGDIIENTGRVCSNNRCLCPSTPDTRGLMETDHWSPDSADVTQSLAQTRSMGSEKIMTERELERGEGDNGVKFQHN